MSDSRHYAEMDRNQRLREQLEKESERERLQQIENRKRQSALKDKIFAERISFTEDLIEKKKYMTIKAQQTFGEKNATV